MTQKSQAPKVDHKGHPQHNDELPIQRLVIDREVLFIDQGVLSHKLVNDEAIC